MTGPALAATAATVTAVLVWFGLYGWVLVATRPRAGRPVPATQDLGGAEPPAVVSFLTAGWKVTEDAVESTLLDLAARDHLELRQASDDPRATTVHLVDPATRPSGEPLTAYEQSVLGRVAAVAVGGVAPVTALTFRDEGRARAWWDRFAADVVADARARGLSRRRIAPRAVAALSVAALVPGVAAAAAVALQSGHDLEAGGGAGLLLAALLSGVAGRPLGERDTPEGRDVTARWLGLRRYLAADEGFRDLPPAAVAVWDRYLAYGDALGTTRVCAAVLDLGMGDRKRVWSSYGGSWHRVRVRYPRGGALFGASVPRLLLGSVPGVLAGYLLVRIGGGWGGVGNVLRDLGGGPDGRHDATDLIGPVALAFGSLLLAAAAFRLVASVVDALAPTRLEGEVLWIAVARTVTRGDDQVPVMHYLAVDDGSTTRSGTFRTTAWGLPSAISDACTPGDTVAVTVRRWSRRVTAVEVLAHRSVDAVRLPAVPAQPAPAADGGTPAAPVAPARTIGVAGLLGPIAAALGTAQGDLGLRATAATGPTGSAAAGAVVEVASADGTTGPLPAVTIASASGAEGDLLLAASRAGGRELAGVGDEAWSGPGWASARRGDVTVKVRLNPRMREQAEGSLPALLAGALDAAEPAARTAAAPD